MFKRLQDWIADLSTPVFFLIIFSPFILSAVFFTVVDYGYWVEPVQEGEKIVLSQQHRTFPAGSTLQVSYEPGSDYFKQNVTGNPHRLVQAKVITPDGESVQYRLHLDDFYKLRYKHSGITNYFAWLNHFNSYPDV